MSEQTTAPKPVHLLARAGVVPTTTLHALLEEIRSQVHYMILTNSEEQIFCRFALTQAQKLDTWTEGILFGKFLELRWRPKRGQIAVMLLCETTGLPALAIPQALNVCEESAFARTDITVQLWGEHKAEDMDADGVPFWHEAQIPRLLNYPFAQKNDRWPERIALRVAQYHNEQQHLCFHRFVDLEEWPNG